MTEDINDSAINEPIEETNDKIVCPKCNKQYTINHFRYRHYKNCEGIIVKDYTRPIRRYTKKYNKQSKEVKQQYIPEQQEIPISNIDMNKNTISECTKQTNVNKDYSNFILS